MYKKLQDVLLLVFGVIITDCRFADGIMVAPSTKELSPACALKFVIEKHWHRDVVELM